MCDYPFFIPQVVLFANSSLFWFKVTNEHREFRNYLFFIIYIIHITYALRLIFSQKLFTSSFKDIPLCTSMFPIITTNALFFKLF